MSLFSLFFYFVREHPQKNNLKEKGPNSTSVLSCSSYGREVKNRDVQRIWAHHIRTIERESCKYAIVFCSPFSYSMQLLVLFLINVIKYYTP